MLFEDPEFPCTNESVFGTKPAGYRIQWMRPSVSVDAAQCLRDFWDLARKLVMFVYRSLIIANFQKSNIVLASTAVLSLH